MAGALGTLAVVVFPLGPGGFGPGASAALAGDVELSRALGSTWATLAPLAVGHFLPPLAPAVAIGSAVQRGVEDTIAHSVARIVGRL